MAQELDKMLKQAEELEKTQDYKQLAEIYRKIATYYHKFKDKTNESLYLEKAKAIRNTNQNLSIDNDAVLNFYNNLSKSEQYVLLKEYRDKDSNNFSEYLKLAVLAQELKYVDEAREWYETALKVKNEPDKMVDILTGYSILLINHYEEFELALAYLMQAEKIVKDDERKVTIYSLISIILSISNFKDYDKAKEYYEKTLKINPKNYFSCINYAFLLSNHFNEFDLAVKHLENVIQYEPNNPIAYNNLANILSNDYFRNYTSAKEYLEKSILLNPNYFQSHHNLANLYLLVFNDNAKAQYHFAKAIELNKDFEYSVHSRNALAETIEKTPYITKIEIQKLRHLSNFEIEIDNKESKHLLLTGTNGSGKTTVLNECKKFLQKILDTPIDELFTDKSRDEIFFPKNYTLKLIFNTERLTELRLAYESSRFIVKYLGANTGENGNRALNPQGVEKIEKVQLPPVKKIEDNLADKIVAYLVDLDYRRLRAFRNKEEQIYTEIDKWFDSFLKALQLFDEHIVDLKYSDAENTHNFIIKVKNPIDRNEIIDVKFDELPDGFKAVFKIVFEIILQIVLQIQTKVHTTYGVPGIVLIDEPELFLHIKMQKKILPALTSLFPKIQFVVATHSPFVLNSISNAVIYDLEKQIRLVDVSDIPANKLNDYYFSFSPEYVESIKVKVDEFEKLIELYKEKKLDKASKKRLTELDIELDEVTPYISDEYFKKFKDNQKYLYE